MPVVTGMTAAKMQEIEDRSIIDASIDETGHLILLKHDDTTIDLGDITGPQGDPGDPGDPGDTGPAGGGLTVCTSGTRPSAADGVAIWETDTDKMLIYNGVRWDQPWNLPWGEIDRVEEDTSLGPFSSESALGMASTQTYVANRKIKLRLVTNWHSSVADDSAITRIKESSTVLSEIVTRNLGGTAGQSKPNANEVILSPTAGSHTYTPYAQRLSGTGNITMRATSTQISYFVIEDIGPNGAPA